LNAAQSRAASDSAFAARYAIVLAVKPWLTRSVLALSLSSIALVSARSARAEDGAKTSSDDATGDERPAKAEDTFGHGGQVGLRVGLVGGYRMILRYEDTPLCADFDPEKGTDQQKFCGHGAPFALATALSYGIADWLEPFAWARFGLAPEDETATEPVVMFGLGVRIYTMSDSAFKIFIEPAIGLEVEDGKYAEYDTDVALHLAAGPSYDFARYFGAYLTGGVTTTIIRSLATSLEVELGVQGRY
jgi:hypothetical protein